MKKLYEQLFNNNYFFVVVTSKILICSKGNRVCLNLNQITNVRIVEKRNLIPNFILFSANFFFAAITLVYFRDLLFQQLTACLIVITACFYTFKIELYSYSLLISTKAYGFHVFKLPKSAVNQAIVFRNRYNDKTLIIDNEEEIYYFAHID